MSEYVKRDDVIVQLSVDFSNLELPEIKDSIDKIPSADMLDKLELLEKKMDRIKVLMDATGESIEQMLAYYADAKLICKDCIFKGECADCYNKWLKFLEASDE